MSTVCASAYTAWSVSNRPMKASWAPLPILRTVLWTLLASSCLTAIVAKDTQAQTAEATSEREKEVQLERDFTDPLTTLPQLTMRDSYSPATYGTHVQTNQAIVRPIIPRVPPQGLLPFVQLIRPTFSLVTIPDAGGGTRTEFGDTAVFDVAVLPWPSRESGLLMGIGPAFIFPTATSKGAGQEAWQAGPTFAAVYKGIPGLLAGFVAQNPISFAYTKTHSPAQNTLAFQPALALHLYGKWYLRSAEATWMMGWHHHSPTTLPLSLAIGRTFVRSGWPPMSLFVGGQWMAYRQFAPVTPQTTVNFGMTIAFPELKIW